VLTHSSLHEPEGYDYIDPDHPDGISNLWETFLEIGEGNRKFCFLGHAHTPVLWGFVGYQEQQVELPKGNKTTKDEVSHCKLKIRKYERIICSVGSVGQPRDRDPRACYAIFDGKSVVFRRVPYDIAKTADKIRKNPELRGSLAARLFSAL
jgi:diadenosine tetraphosphatase ApaH/serine/threonine PP2A family protein phosphatase